MIGQRKLDKLKSGMILEHKDMGWRYLVLDCVSDVGSWRVLSLRNMAVRVMPGSYLLENWKEVNVDD